MSEFRKWAFWRRIQYGSGFLVFTGFILTGIYFGLFYSPSSCFDTVQGGTETGVDCGGDCVRICTAEVIPPQVVWADSFLITEGQYNAVAYIENKNVVASTPELRYTFELLNGEKVVATRSGTTVLPPNSTYPVFEGRITTDSPVTSTRLTLETADLWLPATIGREQFKTANINLTGADARPRLEVEIENKELTAAEQVEVVATLFNYAGEPVTASETIIDKIEARERQSIVFTWPNSITKTVHSCVIPTDVVLVIDLSGSMNNDGGNPPQPVTSALLAAQTFVSNLRERDQSAVVRFATTASTPATLSKDHASTAALVESLTINPADETGYTNTSAGLLAAGAELNSIRHNEDARRVLVLLTDGLPTSRDDSKNVIEEAKATAKTLTDSGVSIYAIGIGKNVATDFISAVASSPEQAFIAPTGNDLASIYATITSSLCESGTARIDIIAKTKTNFTPLR